MGFYLLYGHIDCFLRAVDQAIIAQIAYNGLALAFFLVLDEVYLHFLCKAVVTFEFALAHVYNVDGLICARA